MYFLSTFLSVAMLLLLLVPGFILRKIRLVSDAAAKDLSGLLIYIGMPALIFYCMMDVDITLISWQRAVICLLLAVIIHLIGFVAIKLMTAMGKDKAKRAAASFCAMFSNCGFLGIPLTKIAIEHCEVFTENTENIMSEAMLYVTLFNVVFNLLNWTLGVSLYDGAEKKSAMVRKAVLNPCTIALVVALPFTLTGLSLNEPFTICGQEITQVASFIQYLYNICVPVSMCILGIRLADMKIRPMFKNKYMYASIAVKMFIVPALTTVICLLLHRFCGIGGALVVSMVVMAATPSATTALAFAERFNGDTAVAGECIVSSTVAAVAMVPLFLMVTAAFL